MRIRFPLFVVSGLILFTAVAAAAQEGPPKGGPKPPASIEILAGYSGFVDDAMIDHSVFGGAARIYLTPRLSVGPEVSYMRGPGDDRDLYVLGNLTFDLLRPRSGKPRRVSPFLIVGGGFFTHTDRFGNETFTSSEGAIVGGGGARVHITHRVYVIGDFRIGWEPHYRITGGIGISM